jgi:sulfhydrogenase subunit beta (sulfur reductase)
MIKKMIAKEDWGQVLEGLKGDFKVFVPVKQGDFHNFRLLGENGKPDFDFQNTRLSPKSVIFPQSERMFEYSLDESKEDAHIVKEAPKDFSPQVIVGIRP